MQAKVSEKSETEKQPKSGAKIVIKSLIGKGKPRDTTSNSGPEIHIKSLAEIRKEKAEREGTAFSLLIFNTLL